MKRAIQLVLFGVMGIGFILNAYALSDPTAPPGVAAIGGSFNANAPVQLQSIINGERQKYAFVNGAWLSQGDKINGFTVTKINSGGLVLSGAKKQITVPLIDAIIKTPAEKASREGRQG